MIDLRRTASEGSGIVRRTLAGPLDDWRGVHYAFELVLPDFEELVYYAPPWSHWPVTCCRMHPFVRADLTTLGEGGALVLLRTESGYLGLLPLALRDSYGWFSPEDGRLTLRVGGHGTEELSGERPLLAWAASDDPYHVLAEVFRLATDTVPDTKLRDEKPYPEPFRFLGWCSWEEYHTNISGDLLAQAIDAINASPAPVRYLLIDDGHQDFVNPEDYFARRLRSFQPNAEKFPDGYEPLLRKRSPEGLSWFGLWTPFSAGMCGIAPDDNRTGLDEELLATNAFGGMLPKDDPQAAETFMGALLDAAAGFDFVKIDFMSFAIAFFSGASQWQHALEEAGREPEANPYRQSWRMNRALEELLPRKKLDLMNCNAQGPYNLFNHSYSSSSRCSCDYSKGDAARARQHLFQSYANIPWQGQLVWGDHDMFHSCDPLAGRMMAVSKALSGGPVYLSDAPDQFVAENIAPLCYEDGRLLRPLAPAGPLPDSLFQEYTTADAEVEPHAADDQPYRVIAPLAGGAAAIAAYHLSETDAPMPARIAPEDYRWRGAMLQPYPGLATLPGEGLVIWDYYEGRAVRLDDEYTFELENLHDRLLLLLPIVNGWAIGGRFDKFLGPAAVEVLENRPERLRLRMHESGPLAVWLAKGRPVADGLTFEPLGTGFFVAQMPVGTRGREVVIRCGD